MPSKVIEFQRVVRKRLFISKDQLPPKPAEPPKAPKPPAYQKNVPAQQHAGFCVIAQAKTVLGERLVERKHILFLDGRAVTIPELLRAANRDLKAKGKPMLGKNPERWM